MAPKPHPAPSADMVRMYEQGASLKEVAAHYGCSDGTVLNRLRQAGVKRRSVGSRPGSARPSIRLLTEEQDQEAARMYREGATIGDVAEAFNVSLKASWNALKRAGVTFRTASEASRHTQDVKDVELGPRVKSRWQDDNGYVVLRISRNHPRIGMANKHGRVLEHRLIMAESLDRDLTRSETVHHQNGVRDDNRLENLQLRQGKHGKGEAWRCCDCGSFNVEPSPLTSG